MNDETLTITRYYDAPPERVFDAFTKKEAIQAWFGPDGFTVPNVSIDPRPGGKYRFEMHSPEGSIHVVTGEFQEVRRPARLVFTWAWLEGPGVGPRSLVTLTFAPKAKGTELVLNHSEFATKDARDRHNQGWTSSFMCLERTLAGKSKPMLARPTLLGDPRSTHVRSARMAFEEKGIAYTLEAHPPHTEAINAINPFGKIPAFRCGSLSLYETSAIMRYVDEAFPGPRLMPEAPAERALAEQWVSCVHCYFFDSMIARYVLQYIFPKGPDGKPDQSIIAGARKDMAKHLEILDTAYGARGYLVGENPSIADLLLAPIVFYIQNMPDGQEVLAPFGNVRRAHSVIAERTSFKATTPPTK